MAHMVISDENNGNLTRPSSFQDMVGKKFGQEIKSNRRALGVINQGLAGANQSYPCVVNKRGLSDKQEMCEKKQADPLHRPITRRFAAQIASTKSSSLEVKKQPSSNGFGESIFIDGDVECELAMDHPVPMFLEDQSEEDELPDQTDHMEEVEMEDIEEDDEPIVDIDVGDKSNSLAVVDYVNDIYAFYRKMEGFSCVAPNYMTHQYDINEKMRSILIDWLIEVHDKFDLMKETLFLTVNLIDRFLSKQTVVRKKLQLVGLVSMLLACKYEEVSVPVVGDLILISDKAYTRQDVLDMEQLMLNTLQFNMSVPTPYVFMKRFLKASQSDNKLEHLSFFLIELSLVEYEMLKFPPSLMAAAAIFTAQCSIYGFKHWNKTFEWHANYSQDQLLECSRLMVGYHQRASTGKLTGVHRKYSTSKFVYTSKCGAADFLLNTEDHL